MLTLQSTGEILGATVEGADLAQPFDEATLAGVVRARAEHGVPCSPRPKLDAAGPRRFGAQVGTLEGRTRSFPTSRQKRAARSRSARASVQ